MIVVWIPHDDHDSTCPITHAVYVHLWKEFVRRVSCVMAYAPEFVHVGYTHAARAYGVRASDRRYTGPG